MIIIIINTDFVSCSFNSIPMNVAVNALLSDAIANLVFSVCFLCHSESACHYNALFVIMLVSLGSQNKHYNNEVAV